MAKEEDAAKPLAEAAGKAADPDKVRKIPGNLPYMTAAGTLKKVLDNLIEAQRPEKFSVDFVANVLKMTGGGARATIPILKKMGFLTGDGTPTELYARFRTDGGRSAAALQGLRNAFPEIFKRSDYAHAADDSKLKDVIVQITGLKPSDQVATAIRSTFKVINSFVSTGTELASPNEHVPTREENDRTPQAANSAAPPPADRALSLAYNINIVLPETSDLSVLNAIFRSIKENLL